MKRSRIKGSVMKTIRGKVVGILKPHIFKDESGSWNFFFFSDKHNDTYCSTGSSIQQTKENWYSND